MDTGPGPYGGYGALPGFPGQGAQKSNTMMYIGIVIILVAAVAAYYFLVIKKKPSAAAGGAAAGGAAAGGAAAGGAAASGPVAGGVASNAAVSDTVTAAGDAGVSADDLQAAIATPPPEPGADESVTQETIAAPPSGVNCEGQWTAWSDCSKPCDGGKKSRTYKVTTPASGNGEACPRKDGEVEEVACNEQPCPVDCVGEWTDWSSCSQNCGSGNRKRTYKHTRPAAHGGKACEVDNQVMEDGYEQSEPCNTDPCPVACVGQWNEWGACSSTCGGGIEERSYTHITPAAHGGAACPASNGQKETRACNTQPCPVDCQGAWTAWENCPRNQQGYQKRTYKISTPAAHGGKACPISHDTIEGQYCNQGSEYWMSVANHNRAPNQIGGVEILGPKGAQAIPGVLEFKAKWYHYGRACGRWSNRSCTTGVKMYINDQQRGKIYRNGKTGKNVSSNWYRIKGVKSGDIIKAIEEGDRTQNANLAWKFYPNDTTEHPTSIDTHY